MWHYIDYPYKPHGQPATVPAPPPGPENIVEAFQRNVAVLQSAAPDGEKAVALCWVFHLMGDSHQLPTPYLSSRRNFPRAIKAET